MDGAGCIAGAPGCMVRPLLFHGEAWQLRLRKKPHFLCWAHVKDLESCLIFTNEYGHLNGALQLQMRNLSLLAWSARAKSMADNKYKVLFPSLSSIFSYDGGQENHLSLS